ncbi:vacuolar protein-like protein sorting 29 [Tribonema minus]|uniref:Vacuolar protein sorting-associated protein 29 n=1 Tax=Tribonema minus TaxID=303371 RepID=A0A835ZKD1_9STRA|nr:vacuolar protein-like protein sorting 29 [Tribonema minus]
MGDFGELVLVLGDLHIPHRAAAIPEKFRRMLVPNKMKHVLCTGNLVTKDRYEELRALAPNVHVVSGDFDDSAAAAWPESKVVHIGAWRIGLVHGHQVVPWGDPAALSILQRQLDCDILVSGHTHRNEVRAHEGRWLVNPGSITGAYSPIASAPAAEPIVPSFMLLAIQGARCVAYVYELRGGQVDVTKSEFTKDAGGGGGGGGQGASSLLM